MIIITIITLIVAIALLLTKISPLQFSRLTAITFLFCLFLSFNALYIESLGIWNINSRLIRTDINFALSEALNKLNSISISQYLLFWTLWILFIILYYIFILYALFRGHVKNTLGEDPIMEDKSSKFIPKFIINHYNRFHTIGATNFIPEFEMFFRSLMMTIGIVSINILISIVLSFYS